MSNIYNVRIPTTRIHRFEGKDVALVTPLALLNVARKCCKPPLILVVSISV
jgi:hypothetical protein